MTILDRQNLPAGYRNRGRFSFDLHDRREGLRRVSEPLEDTALAPLAGAVAGRACAGTRCWHIRCAHRGSPSPIVFNTTGRSEMEVSDRF